MHLDKVFTLLDREIATAYPKVVYNSCQSACDRAPSRAISISPKRRALSPPVAYALKYSRS